ncbi:MAG: alpha-L-fucosidase [Clostridia bacterium]|nr:alpha-L-fucosidase [Clostridia bacterium]
MSSYKRRKTVGDTEWLVHDRFGMFIHFGLYSLPARHEWIKSMERIPEAKYDQYFKHFNPDIIDCKEWARKAKAAGMKYAVLTTKHHEGFCLFDSKFTDYKVTNTPYGKDIVREYVDAFRAEGIKIGFYYSLIDWHHPDFTIDTIHPRRDDGEEMDKGRDIKKYAEYMRNQVTELLTNYGKIDVLWFDFTYPADRINAVEMLAFDKGNPPPDPNKKPWMQSDGGKTKEDWESEKLMALIRSLQPDIVINNRLDIEGDTVTPEQSATMKWPTHKETGEYLTWEVCHTFSGSWGYFRDEMTWKSPKMLIDTLVKMVAYGGNLLMNVGPTSRGLFDHRADEALQVYADWMKYNSRSIYGCTMAEPEFTATEGTYLTQSEDGKRLYIHMVDYPFKSLVFENLAGKVDYCQFLHDGSEILFTEKDGYVKFVLPVVQPQKITPVIEIFLK